MSLWLLLAVNSITLGGLLFLLAAGFSLIFGLMRIPNLAHGSFFMLGAYFAVSLIRLGMGFWPAALAGRARRRALRRHRRAAHPAPARRGRAGAGAGHPGPVLHGRRRLPHGVDRRPHPDRHARAAARRHERGGPGLPHLSARRERHRRDRRGGALDPDRSDAARRHDPRRRR